MPENRLFLPEGLNPSPAYAFPDLKNALETGEILEGAPQRCGADHTLFFTLGGVEAQMARQEAVAPWISGSERDISVLSRVGKPTCFTVKSIQADEKGAPFALLSRREAQENAMSYFLENLEPGMVLACRAGEKLGVTVPGTGARVRRVLERYGLPVEPGFSCQEIVEATALDKKSDGETLRFILIKDIGESLIYPMTRAQLLEALA